MKAQLIIEINGDRRTELINDFIIALSLHREAIKTNYSRDTLQRILVQLQSLLDIGVIELLDIELLEER